MLDLVYIASPSYSGSTLLTFLLNAHPAVATVGELKWGAIDLATYRCSCGELLRECGFWARVGAEMRHRGLPFDLKRPATDFRCRHQQFTDRIMRAGVRGPLFESIREAAVAVLPSSRQCRATVRQVNRGIMEIVLGLQKGEVFLDGSKDPVRLKYLLATGDYRIRVVQLVRDGRAVVRSAIKNQGVSAEEAARDWLTTHAQIERIGRQLGSGRFLQLKYENLCSEPARSLAIIWKFLGLPAFEIPQDYRFAEHHILGNRMRLKPAAPIAADESWRTALGADALACFERIGGQMNRAYDYE